MIHIVNILIIYLKKKENIVGFRNYLHCLSTPCVRGSKVISAERTDFNALYMLTDMGSLIWTLIDSRYFESPH